MTDELPGVEVLRVQPGDALLLTVATSLDLKTAKELAAPLKKLYPDVPVVILDSDASLRVIREVPDDTPGR